MFSTRQQHPIPALAALLASALCLGAALPTPAQTPTPTSLAASRRLALDG